MQSFSKKEIQHFPVSVAAFVEGVKDSSALKKILTIMMIIIKI